MIGSFIMFHYVRGIPFDFNAGAYDNLNMWEQIDQGAQLTPAKKFLFGVPVGLFLVSTHYTHYDLTYFIINLMATLAVVIPKLPSVSTFPLFLVAFSHVRTHFGEFSKGTVLEDQVFFKLTEVWRSVIRP
jgi:sodium/hydrogen antiporter